MLWAILIIFGSVLGGTILALLPRERDSWMGPARTFALTAALSVVVMHLLPESLAQVGAWAILVFLAGLIAPEMLGKLGETLWRARGESVELQGSPERRRHVALEASYFGLLLHRVGDGIGLGAFTSEMHVSSASGGVIAAMAAHAIPVVAIVVLTFDSVRGRGSAITRAVGLALASMVGVLMAHSLPADSFAEASGYIAAFVGGTLLHVVTHDIGEALPKTRLQRVIDILAAALGVVVSFVGQETHSHADAGDHAALHFEEALIDFAVETGPLLMLGLVIGAFLTAWGPRIPAAFFRSRGVVADAAKGTIVGAPLPLCSCSVLPISAAMVGRGAGPAMVVAFLLATPELGVETFALSVRFLGWEMAWIRLGGALLLAFCAAMIVSLTARKSEMASAAEGDLGLTPDESLPLMKRVLQAFDELLHHIGAWMILGLVAAALLEVALPAEALEGIDGWFAQFAVVTLVAVPSYVCAPSATPLAAVLLGKGISPGAVLVGLLLGPATNIATVVFLRRWFGSRGALIGLAAVVVLAWLFGLVVDGLIVPETLGSQVLTHEHDRSWWVIALAVISGLVVLRALYTAGVRGFLSTLSGAHGHSHGDDGSHGHSHGHAHGESDAHADAHGESHAHGHAHGESHRHGHAHGDPDPAEHSHAHGNESESK